jgi:hypothetical protein
MVVTGRERNIGEGGQSVARSDRNWGTEQRGCLEIRGLFARPFLPDIQRKCKTDQGSRLPDLLRRDTAMVTLIDDESVRSPESESVKG